MLWMNVVTNFFLAKSKHNFKNYLTLLKLMDFCKNMKSRMGLTKKSEVFKNDGRFFYELDI